MNKEHLERLIFDFLSEGLSAAVEEERPSLETLQGMRYSQLWTLADGFDLLEGADYE